MTRENQNQDTERMIEPETNSNEELAFDITLRPQKLADFVGQGQIKNNLTITMQAAKQRHEPIEHVLLYGNPGLGKTTLAHIIAKEMNANIKTTSGPTLEKVGDLAAILTNLQEGEILFIDEIHRLNKTIEEVLYPALEDYVLDIIIGKGPAARSIRMPLNRFTLIGATTKMGSISSPLRDRFGHSFHLEFYENEDIVKIINRNAKLLDVELQPDASQLVAQRSRRTPRIANRLLKRVRDYTQVKGDGKIHHDIAKEALEMLAIDHLGLDEIDRRLLRALIEKFAGGPVGLNTLSAAISEEMDTIETIYEPFLLQLGFLERTPRGRKATTLAYQHFDLPTPKTATLL
ncbi:MAG: Holliday junction branch migration DNA helicase RuvB [Candidatus Magasanikbacteria bacterium CG10_big_fil_rev_8_21_14_0_10_40_10]|uniref:Holliday junction branch migration complex subunit RuvB n=1 Tax=Candidatus Magasanikbacteria bacterium CG10_big_fil_rev_8_21_14_0_10_40_10 TaxID=1974648 RepID=A0A2M6W2N1_9BACT|nr:MAG: Holliday junction branch migration DNA helicase RuvB [Candidatus Magasanikbacteria bacterium CG10_big_fil_rev_8_21_14_0_10_40_10]